MTSRFMRPPNLEVQIYGLKMNTPSIPEYKATTKNTIFIYTRPLSSPENN
jgi:hypothetical protein